MSKELEELRSKVESLETRASEMQKEAEERAAARKAEEERRNIFYKGNHNMNNTENRNNAWAEFAKAMIENRALSITDQDSTTAGYAVYGEDDGTHTGRIAQVNQLWDLVKQKELLLDRVSYFYGPNFETQIPVLESLPAVPTEVGEGWNNNDPNAFKKVGVGVAKVSPITHVGILPITYECARQSFVNLEARIPQLLSDSFRTGMCNMLFAGIFNKANIGNKIEASTANEIKLADLEALALAVLDTDSAEPVIVMNPDIYSKLATTNEVGYDFIREELVRNKSVEGIKVILTGKAPKFYGESSTLEAGDIAVFAGDLKNFAFGVADQVTIEPIKRLGDSNTYYQAIGAWNGIMVQPKNVWGITKKA